MSTVATRSWWRAILGLGQVKRLASLLPVLAVLGCAGPAPSADDIAGVWDCDGGGFLRMERNGHAELSNVRGDWLVSDNQSVAKVRPFSSSGSWTLNYRSGTHLWDIGVDWDVGLTLSHAPGHENGLYTLIFYTKDDGRPVLYFVIGDPDDRNRVNCRKRR